MAGSSNVLTSTTRVEIGRGSRSKSIQKVLVSWVGDDTDGTVPNLTIDLFGWCVKAITNPGSTAPTDNYDIVLGDPNDAALDALESALANRDTATTEQVYTTVSGAAVPVLLAGTYTLKVSGNSVNDATGTIEFYLIDEL